MERKVLALADSGIMPVSGNEEPGVLSRKSSNSLFPYKKRYSVLYPHAPIHPSRNVDDLKAIGTAKVSVKNDVVPKQGESHSKLELPADSGHIELSLSPKKLLVSSLVDSNTTPSCLMRGTVNPSLLSPSLNNNDADDAVRINRFNWDLNIPMDLWEASGDDIPVQDASQIDSKPPSNSASVIGSNSDKGMQVVGASKQEFNFPISSIHPALRHKSGNMLCVSLGSTLQGFDSSVLQSKSEPVEKALVQANAGTVVRPAGTFEANVVKTEVVRQNLQSIELSSKELLDQKPMKCEPFMRSDAIAPQSVRRVLQPQESSSSSTCSDMSYFDHTKNANFDLKELNVCSDKVEASVSASMSIEDHMVYKNTQDTHNLVTSGEGSANDGEKISISAGTEKKCYASDCYKAFAGHVDTEGVGCVREDEECEDGEIREPLMQSIAEDPNVEGMDSGKNNESSSKNVQNIAVFRPVTGTSLPLRSGRERYFYMEEEKFHLQKNRDEIYGYGPKFVRDRFQGHPFGRSRGNFMRGRGRGWGWGRGRYSGHDFESYDNRHKHTAAFWESANERKDYDNRLDGGAIASKDAAVIDISLRRCPGEDGSAYVGVRQYRPNHHFGQGDNAKFTAMQRSGFPRMWSKSPVRSRTWSLPPRTLTEGLNGRQNLSQHRSPVMYREDRIRSSSRTSFTEEAIATQRRDPPSYTARHLNNMRDVDAVFTRTNRPIVEILDHHSRADGDGYFDGPIHTGRFPELHSDERRKYGERQMRNVKEQEGGNVGRRCEEEFDGPRLKKKRF
ncbi:hypothetical protein R3W88_011064 [Solanum pinnatisectum]|uniref:Btz domain-containing protein n=1 Tax=Solanum pinnatisectum TaxID=50273 RepID=A0AAV9L590_9SOLN|nr:hypothetical protein R3W88_011064 [Solanum pinnatisectum]